MFNHVAHLTLLPDASHEQFEAIAEGLLALPPLIDGLVSAEVVRDAGLVAGNASLRFHLRFADRASWEGYKSHPAHVAVITERIAPVLADKVFVQYEDDAVRSFGP
ncbi:Dabb family protein [Nocardioides dubius]|uniref:Stress-response A/B barrel domain-containing protein n=1 Tax=Nocardioides dubius TaxID=317019 RepID=A0ABN1U136_9ACTN